MTEFPKTLIIGASGLVGSRFLELASPQKIHFLIPKRSELDITDKEAIQQFISEKQPSAVINFAAHTNLAEAEKLRGDKESLPWQLNVEGAKNIASACQSQKTFLIHISTDAIFPGTKEFPGPYTEESIPPQELNNLSWYGYTKLMAEEEIKKLKRNYAIVRISHPFGHPNSERDFAIKVKQYIKIGYELFSDQIFTPTYINDLTSALLKILVKRETGIFHVTCRELISPFEFANYLALKLQLEERVKEGSVVEFMKIPGRTPKTKLGGLLIDKTERLLGVKFHSWQEALDEFIALMMKD